MIRNYYGDGNTEGNNSYYSVAKSKNPTIVADLFNFLSQNHIETNNPSFQIIVAIG